ncbi:MFS transporter [Oryzibacter oryziterrae]|uniref:MFS transporter n=1 Tax=Oryzibacter oryziterrae TaxID=2766474 RepID=UPI001F1BF2C3|nr:MFS transporter [Oryzibacter oryziterrae]
MSTTPTRARWSVAAVFCTNGALFGSWAPNVPLIRDKLHLTDSELSLALLALAGGAVVAMPIAGYLISRFGSAGPTRYSILGMVLALPLLSLAPSLAMLCLCAFLFGFSNGVNDVAMNTHAVEVERQYARPIMSGLHGTWSIGGFLASSLAGLLLNYMGTTTHFLIVTAFFLVVAGYAVTGLLPGEADKGEAGSHFALPDRSVLVIGILTLFGFMLEGAMLDWNAIFMRTTFNSDATMTAAGYAAFAGGMAIGRFSGDFIRLRQSAVHIVRFGAIMAAIGILIATYVGQIHIAILAFGLTGLGVSNLVPLFFTAAGRANVASSGKGVAAAATCGYCGFLAGPPIIGYLSTHTGLGVAFVLLAVAQVAIAIFAMAVRPADQLPGQ